jgi:DNA-binding winged helix-turn-helix (wHTH) protein/tetratricopeptide (TPR) repeat protein
MTHDEIYEFGEFRLDVIERRLFQGQMFIPLAPKAHDVLVELVRHAGRLLTKRDLLELVWPESFVEEGILAVHISALRKALCDKNGRSRFIETIPRSGYRFIAPVRCSQGPGAGTHTRQAVAVLPARAATGEVLSSRDRSVGLAIADALIDAIRRFPQIVVRPTRAVVTYMDSADDPLMAGRALRVDAVVDSQLVGMEDGVRVHVRLLRIHDGAVLWNGTFARAANEVAAIADFVAGSVASVLGDSPAKDQPTYLKKTSPADPRVYELIGRGRAHLLSASMFEVPKAVEAFRSAVELDPTYAPAQAGLALACCARAVLRVVPPTEAYKEARQAALRALAMDDACADAQLALGQVMFFSEWNWIGAERSLVRALQLSPNHSDACLVYGQLLDALGRLEEGLDMKMRALERDPFSPLVHLEISLSYWHQRRYDDAIEWANKTLALDPLHPHAREFLAGSYLKKGDPHRYMAENLKHAELHGVPPEFLESLKQACEADERAGIAKFVLRQASVQPDAFPPMQLALLYGQTGDMDAAFQYLEKSIDGHDPALVHLAVGPQWDDLRSDPRFEQCLMRIGLNGPQSQQEPA